MQLTTGEAILTIVAVALGVMITRFLPFVIFNEKAKIPKIISYISNLLPAAMMGLLIVFSFKDVSFIKYPFGMPEFIAAALVVVLHLIKRNVLLSIMSGTAVYMVLVQFVFI